MNKYVSLGLITFAFGVGTVCAQSAPQPPQLPQEIKLTVTPAELDLISEGLQTQPFGKVVPLINKLRQQFIEQQPKPITPQAVEPK